MKTITEEAGESRAAIEALAPAHPKDAPPRELEFDWKLPDGRPIQKRYIQAELGFFAVEELTTRITEIIDQFMKGEMGIKIGELFQGQIETPVEYDAESVNTFMDENEQLINAFISLVKLVPDLRLDITCWSLGIPRKEIPWAKDCLSEAPYRGGLSVEDGMDILIYFVKQNVPLLRRTLVGKAQELVAAFQSLVVDEETQTSSGSTPQSSATTQQPTTTAEEFDSPGGTPSSTSSAPTPASA